MANPMWHPYRVPRVEKPRAEGCFYLPTGRRLGFAEFGEPSGELVLWFHGTPGGRRQFPLLGRRAAEKLGLRVIVVGRPGTGLSDPHPYESVADWATDVAHVVDALGADWVSSGSPAAALTPLACAAVAPLSGKSRPWRCWELSSRRSGRTPLRPVPSSWPAASPQCCAGCVSPWPKQCPRAPPAVALRLPGLRHDQPGR